jgi:glycosyltransferase involved in cell wall biosynthesis
MSCYSDAKDENVISEVAIVMTAYNEARFIERALRSCINQSAPSSLYQTILVDDGSTDATLKIARQYEPEVKILVNETQLGLPASINRAIQSAKVRFVVRVDADDYVHSDFVRALYLFLDLNPYMDAIACDYYVVDEHESRTNRVNCVEEPIGCGVMFRKDRLIEIGLYDESFLMAEDLDLRMRFEKHWPIHRLELPLYRYRMHRDNMTTSIQTHQSFVDRARLKNETQSAPPTEQEGTPEA